ncbi:hypothetical protein [Microcoleus vaginatus]|uniref:hypothetical protein n=1 Tax=Microcoleus vaginatus TaxID=119532 RepID=UPI00168239C9|nr:hypothetical protein [Microcoleus sp. FACHB-84]MBD2011503.1 hypothetical protein [Microcoleus sp. FACHB-45]
MIAFIVPRREAGAAGGLPHFGQAAAVGWVRSLPWWMCEILRGVGVSTWESRVCPSFESQKKLRID